MAPETLKEQVDAFWASRREAATLKEAQHLQKLRAERIRLEAKTERIKWTQREESKIEQAQREIKAEKRQRRERILRPIAKGAARVVGGGVSSVLGRKQQQRTPRKPRVKKGYSIFNPPNVFTGRPVHKRRR